MEQSPFPFLNSKSCFSFAKAFEISGVKKGDIICMLMGRSNTDVFYAAFGAWIVGAVLFFGDVRVGAKALANQVSIGPFSKVSSSMFIVSW